MYVKVVVHKSLVAQSRAGLVPSYEWSRSKLSLMEPNPLRESGSARLEQGFFIIFDQVLNLLKH